LAEFIEVWVATVLAVAQVVEPSFFFMLGRAYCPLAGDLYQLANTGLVGAREGVLLHDLVLSIGAEKAAGVVTRIALSKVEV